MSALHAFDDLMSLAAQGMSAAEKDKFISARNAISDLIDAAKKGDPGDMVGWSSALLFKPAAASMLKAALAKVA